MTTNKNDLNPILAGLRLEKSKEFEKSKELLRALQPDKIMVDDSRLKELLKDSQPDNLKVAFQNILKENPDILQNTGSITANALARNCKNQSKIYNLLQSCIRSIKTD